MEINNSILAPEVTNVTECLKQWQQLYAGGEDTFFKFMTTPSVERDRFLSTLGDKVTVKFWGDYVALDVKC